MHLQPRSGAGHLLEVERKMAVTKKRSFERWVERALGRRLKVNAGSGRRFDREAPGCRAGRMLGLDTNPPGPAASLTCWSFALAGSCWDEAILLGPDWSSQELNANSEHPVRRGKTGAVCNRHSS